MDFEIDSNSSWQTEAGGWLTRDWKRFSVSDFSSQIVDRLFGAACQSITSFDHGNWSFNIGYRRKILSIKILFNLFSIKQALDA